MGPLLVCVLYNVSLHVMYFFLLSQKVSSRGVEGSFYYYFICPLSLFSSL